MLILTRWASSSYKCFRWQRSRRIVKILEQLKFASFRNKHQIGCIGHSVILVSETKLVPIINVQVKRYLLLLLSMQSPSHWVSSLMYYTFIHLLLRVNFNMKWMFQLKWCIRSFPLCILGWQKPLMQFLLVSLFKIRCNHGFKISEAGIPHIWLRPIQKLVLLMLAIDLWGLFSIVKITIGYVWLRGHKL